MFAGCGPKRMKISAFIIPELLFEFRPFISPTILKEILQFGLRESQNLFGRL
jgi:hypothetical protein